MDTNKLLDELRTIEKTPDQHYFKDLVEELSQKIQDYDLFPKAVIWGLAIQDGTPFQTPFIHKTKDYKLGRMSLTSGIIWMIEFRNKLVIKFENIGEINDNGEGFVPSICYIGSADKKLDFDWYANYTVYHGNFDTYERQ